MTIESTQRIGCIWNVLYGIRYVYDKVKEFVIMIFKAIGDFFAGFLHGLSDPKEMKVKPETPEITSPFIWNIPTESLPPPPSPVSPRTPGMTPPRSPRVTPPMSVSPTLSLSTDGWEPV